MRRYIPLLLVGLCILFVILAMLLYTTQIVGQKNQKEFIPVMKTLTVYTTMPADMAMIIAEQYKRESNIQVNFVQMSSEELQQKLIDKNEAGGADLIIADSQLLEKIAQREILTGNISEQEDIVAERFKSPVNQWIGIWYDPIVFCYNLDYVKNNWYVPTEGTQLEKSKFFAETYLLPYLQVSTYCKERSTNPYCLITYTHLKGEEYEVLGPSNSGSGVSFVLNSGVVVGVTVGAISAANPGDPYDETISRIKITFDIDGPQGYNKKGYDVFMIELGGADGPRIANRADRNKFLPYLYDASKDCDYYVSDSNHACNKDATYGGSMCLAYIVCNGWDFGDKYPW